LKKPLWHPNKIFLIIISVIIILVSTYFSYPLYDRYQNSQSVNVTADDLETAVLIEASAGKDYIVLAIKC
jgi:capsular polysaccharide biosynthesis protein